MAYLRDMIALIPPSDKYLPSLGWSNGNQSYEKIVQGSSPCYQEGEKVHSEACSVGAHARQFHWSRTVHSA